MADDKTKTADEPKTKPVTIDADREKDITIERLKAQVGRLTAEIEARDALDKERAEAEAKARLDKRSAAAKIPVALVATLGEGRREVAPKQQLRKSELVGLVEGKHYEFVTVDG